MISLPGEISGTRCSRAGCRAEATWAVNWRNPRIHGPERVKVWLACDEHRDFLYDFVAQRSVQSRQRLDGIILPAIEATVDGLLNPSPGR